MQVGNDRKSMIFWIFCRAVIVFSVLREVKGKKRISLLEIVFYFLIYIYICDICDLLNSIERLNDLMQLQNPVLFDKNKK